MIDTSLPLTIIACGTRKGDPTGVLTALLPPGRVDVNAKMSINSPPFYQYGNLRFYDVHFDKDEVPGIISRVQIFAQSLAAEQRAMGRKVILWHCVNCARGAISPFDIEFARGLEKRGFDFMTVVTPINETTHVDEMMVAARKWLHCPVLLGSLWERARETYDSIDYVQTKDGHRLRRGAVVRCFLMGFWDHSGIYVGDGQIVHLSNECSGEIVKTGFHKFLDRMGGWNPAWNVDVACDRRGIPYGSDAAAEVAEVSVGEDRDYNFAFRNCHHFTGGCIDVSKSFGISDADVLARLKSIAKLNFGFSWLEDVIREVFGEFQWCECAI